MSEAIQPAEVNYSLASDPYLLVQAVFYDPESVRERRRRVVKILIAAA